MHAILQLRTAMVLTPSHSHHCYCSRARLFFLLLRILVYAAIFAVLFFVWASVDIDPFFLAAVGVVLILFLMRTTVRRRYACFCISDMELSISCGMLLHATDHIPFSDLVRVRMHRSPLDRFLRIAHLHVYPKPKGFSESSLSYACLGKNGAYVCVLPVMYAHELVQKLRERAPHMIY